MSSNPPDLQAFNRFLCQWGELFQRYEAFFNYEDIRRLREKFREEIWNVTSIMDERHPGFQEYWHSLPATVELFQALSNASDVDDADDHLNDDFPYDHEEPAQVRTFIPREEGTSCTRTRAMFEDVEI
jgi:hypothetical protein